MPEEYTQLVTAAKALTQGEEPNTVTLPMAEDEWDTRPDTVSYGTLRLDFEADTLTGDDLKQSTAYEGSLDLYSLERGWMDSADQRAADGALRSALEPEPPHVRTGNGPVPLGMGVPGGGMTDGFFFF